MQTAIAYLIYHREFDTSVLGAMIAETLRLLRDARRRIKLVAATEEDVNGPEFSKVDGGGGLAV